MKISAKNTTPEPLVFILDGNDDDPRKIPLPDTSKSVTTTAFFDALQDVVKEVNFSRESLQLENSKQLLKLTDATRIRALTLLGQAYSLETLSDLELDSTSLKELTHVAVKSKIVDEAKLRKSQPNAFILDHPTKTRGIQRRLENLYDLAMVRLRIKALQLSADGSLSQKTIAKALSDEKDGRMLYPNGIKQSQVSTFLDEMRETLYRRFSTNKKLAKKLEGIANRLLDPNYLLCPSVENERMQFAAQELSVSLQQRTGSREPIPLQVDFQRGADTERIKAALQIRLLPMAKNRAALRNRFSLIIYDNCGTDVFATALDFSKEKTTLTLDLIDEAKLEPGWYQYLIYDNKLLGRDKKFFDDKFDPEDHRFSIVTNNILLGKELFDLGPNFRLLEEEGALVVEPKEAERKPAFAD